MDKAAAFSATAAVAFAATALAVRAAGQDATLPSVAVAICVLGAIIFFTLGWLRPAEQDRGIPRTTGHGSGDASPSSDFGPAISTMGDHSPVVIRDSFNTGTATAAEREHARQQRVLGRLHNEWLLSNDGISPAMAAGREPLPSEWTEKRLSEMGETWRREEYRL